MRNFDDAAGGRWTATAIEEETPRHHGRWQLMFHRQDDGADLYPVEDVRWQTEETAERTLRTMSVFELRRRLTTARARRGDDAKAGPHGDYHGPPRARTNASAG